jgi:O-acetylhomoserine sulfhydrolase (EC 2.5.1.49)
MSSRSAWPRSKAAWGLAYASGQAAETLSILNIAGSGDNIVASTDLYGGTYNLFRHTLPKLGITTRFVDGRDIEGFRKAIDDRTKAFFLELVGNPRLDVLDLEQIAAVAHEQGVAVIVTPPPLPRTSGSRSSTAPTSWSTRPPSISAATAPASAA